MLQHSDIAQEPSNKTVNGAPEGSQYGWPPGPPVHESPMPSTSIRRTSNRPSAWMSVTIGLDAPATATPGAGVPARAAKRFDRLRLQLLRAARMHHVVCGAVDDGQRRAGLAPRAQGQHRIQRHAALHDTVRVLHVE